MSDSTYCSKRVSDRANLTEKQEKGGRLFKVGLLVDIF